MIELFTVELSKATLINLDNILLLAKINPYNTKNRNLYYRLVDIVGYDNFVLLSSDGFWISCYEPVNLTYNLIEDQQEIIHKSFSFEGRYSNRYKRYQYLVKFRTEEHKNLFNLSIEGVTCLE